MTIDELINFIILQYKSQYCDSSQFNEHWNWITKYPKCNFVNFREYIKFNKQIQQIVKKYFKIYNWLYRRLFINKCIKMVEFYWRPHNPGYHSAMHNYLKNSY